MRRLVFEKDTLAVIGVYMEGQDIGEIKESQGILEIDDSVTQIRLARSGDNVILVKSSNQQLPPTPPKTEVEILQETVQALKGENEKLKNSMSNMNQTISDLMDIVFEAISEGK